MAPAWKSPGSTESQPHPRALCSADREQKSNRRAEVTAFGLAWTFLPQTMFGGKKLELANFFKWDDSILKLHISGFLEKVDDLET